MGLLKLNTANEFEIGDKVIIVAAQENVPEMIKLIGKTCTIASASEGIIHWYELKEDIYHFHWFEEWLKPAYEIDVDINEWTQLI